MKKTTPCLAALLLAAWSSAGVPPFVNYQGRLIDGTNLVNGRVTLSLRLYNLPDGGSLLYEDRTALTVVDGLYSTFIGDDPTGGSLANALTNAEVWIEVVVNGTVLSPRERMASVGYALVADGVSSGAITTAMIANGAVTAEKLASNSVGAAHLAAGAVTSNAIATGAVSGHQIATNTITTANVADRSLTAEDLTNVCRMGYLVIPHPAPAEYDNFGSQGAAVGTDRFVVGAPSKEAGTILSAGEAYLYDADGTRLATITNPAPTSSDHFGARVAGVGTNRLVFGVPSKTVGPVLFAGQAYLYDADGTRLATITNPAPVESDGFGSCVAGVGADRFAVAANAKNDYTGQAYLYTADGAWLATITNPAPATGDWFGFSLGGVGSNRFVVGAPGRTVGGLTHVGVAYLYDGTGALLLAITNPAPAAHDDFGNSVAGVGTNRFVIGAANKQVGGQSFVGQAYLYDADGTLLATITNPAPAMEDNFGISVARVGPGRFVVGAFAKTIEGMVHAGQAYLYDAGGTRLATIAKPGPAAEEWFGASVAGVGANRFLVTAPGQAIDGRVSVGQAYLFECTAVTPGLVADGVAPNSVGLEQLDIPSVDGRYVLKTGDTMTGPLTVKGGIASTMWSAHTPINQAGPLPMTNAFTSAGGTLVLSVSGSGYSSVGGLTIGMNVVLDGLTVDSSKIYANLSLAHLAFVPKTIVLPDVAAGPHTISLQARSGTLTDTTDNFCVTVLELPF